MFQNDYRREMDGLRPSPAAVERLNRLLEEGVPARRPRRLGRRAAAALALCAALCVTAVAAGPTLWDALEARLGPYAPFAAEVEGETSGQGLRLELVKAVSDGYTARVYYTLTDETGDRLNGHTHVSGRLEVDGEGLTGSGGSQVVSYDAGSRTLLLEASAKGLDTSRAVSLELTGVDPGERYIQGAYFQPPADARALDTDTTGESTTAPSPVVLSPGQTPQTSPDTADFTISSMGFDGQGRFHIRLAMAEGFDAGWLLAVPYDAAGKQMGSTLEQTAVDGGMDYTIGGVAPDDVADMASIRVYGAYRGPEAAIEGEWSLPVELEPAEQRVIPVGRTLEGGFYVERIEVSGMNIAVYYRGGDKDWFVVWATDKSGVRTGVPMGMMSAGAEDGLNLGLWSFETPAALDELASVTLLGETFPLE